ncbi:MAG TPA: bacteriohemerythrin [Gammaproteobacteria bacterium]
MQMTWTDDLNTGIPEIDAQNRRLAEFINSLRTARESGDRALVGEVLDQLLDFVCNHFMFEEHLMEQAGYEFRAAHEKIHEIFAKRLAAFRGRFANGENICDELHTMLNNWMEIHIKQEDKAYAASLRKAIEEEGGHTWMAGVMKRMFG